MSARSPFAPIRNDEEPFLTVRELDERLRHTLQGLGRLAVEGEIAGFKGANAGGHFYFTLKDERGDASISCVMWRSDAQKYGGELVQNGARVRIRAQADVFVPRGQLQLQVLRVMSATDGNLLQKREELKKKLAAEGLFLPERKRKLPQDPRVIGVVTSASGAAFTDIITVAQRRGAVRILLSACTVQGDDAPRQIRAALHRIAQVKEVDVIILGRGGGSAEDLAAFDDEKLARAIVACPKPVVAAVGHEIDWSIACLAADVRASTPSQAAELVVPDAFGRVQRIEEGIRRLSLAMRARLREDEAVVARNFAALRAPERALAQRHQKLDDLRGRMADAMRARIERGARIREELARKLEGRHPRTVLARARGAIVPAEVRLRAAMARKIAQDKGVLARLASHLQAISPLGVLGRGYAIALQDGRALRDSNDAKIGSAIEVRLHHGSVDATVTSIRKEDEDA